MAKIEARSVRKSVREQSLPTAIKQVLREYAEALVVAILLALVIRFFVVSAYKIPTGSMIPTLKVGDFVLAYRLPYGVSLPLTDQKLGRGRPRRGEVVVFRCPQNPSLNCVKRVVALPGDRVEIVKKRLVINGKFADYAKADQSVLMDVPGRDRFVVLTENLLGHKRSILIGPSEKNSEFGPYIVPPDHFFVLSDNRDTGDDSRTWGAIPLLQLEGKIIMVWMSVNWHGLEAGETWPRIRWQRIFKTFH